MGSQRPIPRLNYPKSFEKVAKMGPMFTVLIYIRPEE